MHEKSTNEVENSICIKNSIVCFKIRYVFLLIFKKKLMEKFVEFFEKFGKTFFFFKFGSVF